MPHKSFPLSEGERALIALLRETNQFRSIEIAIRDDRWHIQSHVHIKTDEPVILFGSGSTFAEAWSDRCDPRLRYGSVH